MADKAAKTASKARAAPATKANGRKAKGPPQKQPQAQTASAPAKDVKGNNDVDSGPIVDLLKSHEKELLAVADSLIKETRQYDEELRQLDIKLELAAHQLLQLERRFPASVLWSLGNFLATFEKAKSGSQVSVGSPQYYLSRQGYRLAMSICLFGDGPARGSHISLYVSLCKGDFDGSLAWPFSLRLYLSILDQTDDGARRRNITKVIFPKVCHENRAFLGRPRGERNPRFGLDKFASVDEFLHSGRQYVRNDAIFVKLEVLGEDLVPV